MIGDFFYIVFYQPLFNGLIFLYSNVGDLGIAVIILTLFVKGVLYPINAKATRSQKAVKKVQPKIKEIQEKYKDNKEKQAEEVLKIYREENINPLSGIFPLFLQFPILISLFQIFRRGLLEEEIVAHLYSNLQAPETINTFFIGILDLSEPNVAIAFLAGIGQFFQSKMMMPETEPSKKGSFGEIMKNQMKYMLPIFTVFILFQLPSAVGFYWLITIAFSIFQQKIIDKEQNHEKRN